jgi:hypothetical protein
VSPCKRVYNDRVITALSAMSLTVPSDDIVIRRFSTHVGSSAFEFSGVGRLLHFYYTSVNLICERD